MADTQKILDALAELTSKVEKLDTKVSNLNLKIDQFSKLAADHEKRISDLEISAITTSNIRGATLSEYGNFLSRMKIPRTLLKFHSKYTRLSRLF